MVPSNHCHTRGIRKNHQIPTREQRTKKKYCTEEYCQPARGHLNFATYRAGIGAVPPGPAGLGLRGQPVPWASLTWRRRPGRLEFVATHAVGRLDEAGEELGPGEPADLG